MTDAVAAASALPPAALEGDQAGGAAGGHSPQAAQFQDAMIRARTEAASLPQADRSTEVSPALRGVFDRLAQVDGQARSLAEEAEKAQLSGGEFTPGEMVMLSVRSHEFMFHAQLTSNMANRTSDGLSQLFRQQS